MGGEAAYRLGASNPYSIFIMHEWYRLVTAMYLHGGLIHIGFNMMVLMDIGPVVEELYGSARFLFLYTATGIVGFLFSAFSADINFAGRERADFGTDRPDDRRSPRNAAARRCSNCVRGLFPGSCRFSFLAF